MKLYIFYSHINCILTVVYKDEHVKNCSQISCGVLFVKNKMIQVTGVIALLVVSVQSSVQQKTSNNYVSSFNDGRLTNKNSWRNSQNSKPEEQWNSGQKMDRMQYLPVTNRIYNWQESNDNYR